MFVDRVSLPVLPAKTEAYKLLDDLYNTRVLTNDGYWAHKLEDAILRLCGGQHCILFSSASTAIECLLSRFQEREFVSIPYSWVTSLSPLIRNRYNLKYKDCGITEPMITTETLENTSINCVHYYTHVYGLPNIAAIEHAVPPQTLLFDGAHSLGAQYKGRPLGDYGLATVYSLHATKGFTSGEGGAIVCNDSDLAEFLRTTSRPLRTSSGMDPEARNLRLSEMAAGFGVLSLQRFDEIRQIKQRIWRRYRHNLRSHLLNLEISSDVKPNYLYAIVIAKSESHRQKISNVLSEKSIATRPYFDQLILPTGDTTDAYPNAKFWAERALALPMHHDLTENDVDLISELVMTHF